MAKATAKVAVGMGKKIPFMAFYNSKGNVRPPPNQPKNQYGVTSLRLTYSQVTLNILYLRRFTLWRAALGRSREWGDGRVGMTCCCVRQIAWRKRAEATRRHEGEAEEACDQDKGQCSHKGLSLRGHNSKTAQRDGEREQAEE